MEKCLGDIAERIGYRRCRKAGEFPIAGSENILAAAVLVGRRGQIAEAIVANDVADRVKYDREIGVEDIAVSILISGVVRYFTSTPLHPMS